MMVSVVLSTYNGEKYIIEQLESLRTQTYSIDEVLIADDNSTDNTVNTVRRYIKDNKLVNWKVLLNKENIGWRCSYMNLLCAARGDLIFTCDQDDVWDSKKIEIMAGIMNDAPYISLLACKYTEFYEDGKERVVPTSVNPGLHKIEITNNIFKIPFPGCSYAIRKDLVNKGQKYWKSSFPHDAFLWRLAAFSETLYVYGEPLFRMRKHINSSYFKESVLLKNKKTKREWLKYGYEIIDMLNDYLIDNNINSSKKHKIIKKNRKWLEERISFYDNKSICSGIKLLLYLDCYPAKRQYVQDWVLVFN